MHCASCGATLPPKSHVCIYCGGLNDTDLRGVPNQSAAQAISERHCPSCGVNMKRRILIEGIMIDRCDNCLGLFFLPSQLEALIDGAVRQVYEVDAQRLGKIIEEEGVEPDRPRLYLKCPDCSKMMNRYQFGARSGVVIDRCALHGVWLDAGELGQILKWVKAGGRIHDERKQIEQLKAENRKLYGYVPSPLDTRNVFKELDEEDPLTRRLRKLMGE